MSIDAQNSENLGEESPSTNRGYHSDSGISDTEEPNLSHNSLSNHPHPSLFWKTPINDNTTTVNIERVSPQILVQ